MSGSPAPDQDPSQLPFLPPSDRAGKWFMPGDLDRLGHELELAVDRAVKLRRIRRARRLNRLFVVAVAVPCAVMLGVGNVAPAANSAGALARTAVAEAADQMTLPTVPDVDTAHIPDEPASVRASTGGAHANQQTVSSAPHPSATR